MMKKIVSTLCLLVLAIAMNGQTYTSLWKQVKDAEQKDLPQTQLKELDRIILKAEKEKAYGQLLKATLKKASVQTSVSTDSLAPAVERLKAKAEATTDVALQAVYYTVIGKIYRKNTSQLSEDWQAISDDYYRRAIAHPEALAAVKADSYEPFVLKGKDSQLYDNDLLSLIGQETFQYAPLHEYYLTTQNRRAQLLSGLDLLSMDEPDNPTKGAKKVYLHRLDSLAQVYADLPECGEVALERYEYMNRETDATAEQKIAYIDEALSRWGSWQRTDELRNARRELTCGQFYTALDHRVWIPNRPQRLRIWNLRSIDRLTVRIYKVKVNGDTELNPNDTEDYRKMKPLLTPLPELTQTRTYSGKKEYELTEDSLQLSSLPVGVYLMETETQPATETARTLFFISDVRVLMQALPENHDNRLRYVVVNATTGKPIVGAKVRLMQRNGFSRDKVMTTLTTNGKGEAFYRCKNQERPNYVFATTDTDRACPEVNRLLNFNYYDNDRITNQTNIFTDRSIYRPGQTVQVAAILYSVQNGYEHEARAGKQVKVELRDANYKIVEEKQLTTDEFGTVSTQFTLPTTALTGRFTVRVDNASNAIRVEEYKRPTFQVEFPKVEQDYKDGDTLTVKATAHTYAGVPVQDARVSYKVERRMAYWWFSYSRYWQQLSLGIDSHNTEVFSSEAVTADDGTFEVRMPMVLPDTQSPMFYNFVVVAEVTDQAGETHQAQLSLPLGNRKTALTADLPEKMLTEEMPKIKLHILNAAGNDVAAELRYQIDGGKWIKTPSNKDFSLPKLKSGRHQLTAIYERDTLNCPFTVFSLDDKRPAAETDDWFYLSEAQFPNDGKPVTLQVGSSDDVHIVYTIVSGATVLEEGAIDRNNELLNRKFTYKPEYGNGITLSFAWIRNGKAYSHDCQIRRPLPDKQLKLKWETFRNRLTPGQEEEWTLSIEAPQTSNLKAQLMATLYDKSLDQLSVHDWWFQPYTWLSVPTLRWTAGEWGSTWSEGYQHFDRLTVNELVFNRFDSECFPSSYWIRMKRRTGAGLRATSVGAQPEEMVLKEVVVGAQKAKSVNMKEFEGLAMTADATDQSVQGRIAGRDIIGNEAEQTEEVSVRENLQETAFFYPQLQADSTGRVSIKFTLPESLTTWRFLSIAHTKDMMYGALRDEAVAQKDVMIQPNMPRFVRVGDAATISACIFNMTDCEQKGTARLQLIDPESEKVVYDERTEQTLAANGTSAVTFSVDGTKLADYSLLVCKMSVSGTSFSDGEQHYLPILPNRERVTVTVPFTQTKPGTKTIDLATLVPADATQSKLTIEYTNNPAWLMIQALPSVAHAHDKCALCQASAFYANSIGKHILRQNPQAKGIFHIWRMEKGQETSLHSSLQKNEELKDLLLGETPWVMDADREAEQKQRLSDFFDTNLIASRLSASAEQLKKLQNTDGSWSWWEGMPGSFYMTVEISELLVRLNQMTDQSQSSMLQSQLDRAFSYMDKEIIELVAEMKKQEKKGIKQTFPSHKALQYLYLSTLDGRKPSAKVIEAQNYLKRLLKKDTKNQTLYEKALTAIILNSPLYIKSLKEYTVYKEDMGRYYDSPRATYSWRDYRIPTQVAAIEAIQRLTPSDTVTVDEMRRWLLQEKRTQAWDTPINSADAIYAFLNGNKQSLKAQPKTVLKVDGAPLETSEATAGIGYVKTALPAAGQKVFTAEKTSTGTSWGAVYAQFMQDTKDIQDQSSEISVKREILTPDNSTISTLKVGQRIRVRLTIEAKRDLDFVEVIDRRAACMEPVNQLSGYRRGYYCAPKDNATHFFFNVLHKGKHVLETEYYIDRAGQYETGTCTVQCAYAPEFRGTTHSVTLKIENYD